MPGVLNVWSVGRKKWEGDRASEDFVDRSARAREIVDEIGQSSKSAAWPNDNFTPVVDRADVSDRQEGNVGAHFESVAANRVAQGILELIRFMTAPLREPRQKPERRCLASWPQQVCDLDCSRVQEG